MWTLQSHTVNLLKKTQYILWILIEDVDRDKLPHERHDTSETPKRQHIISNRNNIIYFPVPVQNYQYHKINWTHMVPGSLTVLFSLFAISLHDWKRSIGTHSISSPNLSMPITAYTLLTIMSLVEKHCGSSLSSWLIVDTLLISKLFTLLYQYVVSLVSIFAIWKRIC